MRTSKLLFILFAFLTTQVFSANLNAGEKITINELQEDDCYVGAGEVTISAPIMGDLVIGGGEIAINDSVSMDILAGGGKININKQVGDDVRISGGEIFIRSTIKGDLIAFGGRISLENGAKINGDVVVMGGEVELSGDIGGDLLIYGGSVKLNNSVGGDVEIKSGEFDFNGPVSGNMTIQTDQVELGSYAKCMGEIRYWTSDGEVDFTGVCDNATYDEELSLTDEDMDKSVLVGMFGMGLISYWIIVILSLTLTMTILEYFFSRQFNEAAIRVKNNFITSFGYGMLYTLGMPVLIIVSFLIIIGIPVGLFGLSVYGMSLFIATAVIGLTIAHHFKNKSKQDWSKYQLIGYALLTAIILKIIFWIPFLGQLFKTVMLAAVYGAFLMMMVEARRKKKEV